MKFGPEPVGAALEGAILAHTHRLVGGGALKKGRILSRDDIDRLRRGGVTSATVALLEEDDVHEDVAAARVAALLRTSSLTVNEAHTGRVNLHAIAPGVVEVSSAAVDAINAVSEEVTVATLAPMTVVPARVMVATVKIIPFAVSRHVLERIEAAVASMRDPIVRVRHFRPRNVGLILSQLPGMSSALLSKASDVQRARVRALGSSIGRELRCAHDANSVAQAIQTLREEQCDPILVLGASAIVDRRDVIPEALELAGGEVIHLGMPVDPGNLLMFGQYDDTTVLGLPGCARSINLSGFDFVLQRIMADMAVDSQLISGLGTGGLLKEIPSRPQPRAKKGNKRREPRVAAVLLAAGMSRRYGYDNKLLATIDGQPLVRRVASAMIESRADPVLVVLGHESARVRAALDGLPVQFDENPDFETGMSTSLRVGIEAAARRDVDAAVVGLGDMPWVAATHIDSLIDAFDPDSESTICVPIYGRKRGNPVLWSAAHFESLSSLEGDVGGKVLIERFPAAICYVTMEDAGVNVDVDTPEALDALRRDV